jgi:hypothetical protein
LLLLLLLFVTIMPSFISSSWLCLFVLLSNSLVKDVFGFVSVPLPSVVLTMRSSSSNTNVHDLLTTTMRQSNAFFNDYLASFYNVTGSTVGFSHVSVNVKSYGVEPTTVTTRFSAQVVITGNIYYLQVGESSNQVTTLITYALNDNNRLMFINSFLKMSNNPFLQGLTAMEVSINGVMDGSPAPPLPSPTTTTTTPSNSGSSDSKKSTAGLTSVLVIACVLIFGISIYILRRRQRDRRQYHQKQLAATSRSYGPVGSSSGGSHPAFSFGRGRNEAVVLARALGSPSALRADRDEELAPHQGGKHRSGASLLARAYHMNRHRQTVADDDVDEVSQYNTVAHDVEAWKHFASSPSPHGAAATSRNNTVGGSPLNATSGGKKYDVPAWTSQNRFHFDIDDEENDDRVEEVCVTKAPLSVSYEMSWCVGLAATHRRRCCLFLFF